jgi:hypothetical protein
MFVCGYGPLQVMGDGRRKSSTDREFVPGFSFPAFVKFHNMGQVQTLGNGWDIFKNIVGRPTIVEISRNILWGHLRLHKPSNSFTIESSIRLRYICYWPSYRSSLFCLYIVHDFETVSLLHGDKRVVEDFRNL